MNMQKLNLVYFSATGRTEKAMKMFAEGVSLPVEEVKLADPAESLCGKSSGARSRKIFSDEG